jgi:hypothetical protein
MADTKLADLTALTTPSGDDILYIVDDPAGTPLDRKITLDNLFTRGTITADAPVLNMAQTWNNAAVTFTGLKFNAAGTSDANSASASLLMDLQVGTSSRFSVGKTGSLKLGVSPTGTNQAGTNVTISGSQGTGTGPGGSIVFQVAPAGSSGSAQNALATALTINSANAITVGANGTISFPTSATTSPSAPGIGAWVTTLGLFGTSGALAVTISGTAFNFGSNYQLSWNSDTILARDDTNKLALRNGAAAQRFNIYNTYTSSTNYEAFKIDWITTANTVLVGTEKGSVGGTARALEFQTDGTTRLTIATDATITQSGSYFKLVNSSSAQLWLGAESTVQTFVGSISNHPLQLRTNNTERLTLDTTGSVRVMTALTVATLPGTPLVGMIARVTNALTPAVGSTVVGGGAAYALVNYNGANWTVIGV